MFSRNNRYQKGGRGPYAESTGIKRPPLLPQQFFHPPNNDRLSGLPADYDFGGDKRSWGNPERVKERMTTLQEAVSVAQLAPVPWVRYPAMALNSALGAVDTYNDIQNGDVENATIDALSSLPLPDGAGIRTLGSGSSITPKLYRAAATADALNHLGIGSDLTNNYGKKAYQEGGSPAVDRSTMEDWNHFIDYVDSQGMKGSEQLNTKDRNLGQQLFTGYHSQNPSSQLSYEYVAPIQRAIGSYRDKVIGEFRNHTSIPPDNVGPNYEHFMEGLSSPDGWFGSKTSKWKFPKEYLNTYSPQGSLERVTDMGLAKLQQGGFIQNPKGSHEESYAGYRGGSGRASQGTSNPPDPGVHRVVKFSKNPRKQSK